MRLRPTLGAGAALVALGACVWAASNTEDFPYVPLDHPAIQYQDKAPDDAVSRLQAKLDAGEVKLKYDPKWGYLPGLLSAFGINTDSQLLVFSKTSFQAQKISPKHPRALYFNDDVAIGFVPDGDMMELIALDPHQGVKFYTLDRAQKDKPLFSRHDADCLNCHLLPSTLEVPSLLTTSVIPSRDGTPRFPAAAVMVDSRTPLDQRWGGWYVTGTSGSLRHRGNAIAPDPRQPSQLDRHNTTNLTNLDGRIDASLYPEPSSDLIALMTLEHQTTMVALLTRLNWETRVALQEEKVEQFRPRLDFLSDQLASYMLFSGEAEIQEPLAGVSSFTKTFAARGPRDKQGRSLRDFDLNKRLFRYPLSYMIYDAEFDALPAIALDAVYRKLYDALNGKDSKGKYSHLSQADRTAIVEIVSETKSGLPDYWRASAGSIDPEATSR